MIIIEQNMATIKQYLELIPDPEIRERALRNLAIEVKDDRCNSLEHALFAGFLWTRTEEGYKYWYDYYITIPGHTNLIKPK